MLAEKFCDRSGYFAARSSARVEHIFSELYQVPEAFRMGYFKVKILELLLFLSALELPAGRRSYSGARGTAAQLRSLRRISASRPRSSRQASGASTA